MPPLFVVCARACQADRNAITLIVDRVEKLFSQFRYGWLTRQMNETLPLELDFLHEAQNAERLGEILKRTCGDDVIVPAVYHASPRALVMSWEDGVYVTDARQLKASNISLAEVSRLINQAFCDQVQFSSLDDVFITHLVSAYSDCVQIYREGFVHCDPHEANVLVREHPRKRHGHPQVVLLDHGLYRELDDEFRTDYCRYVCYHDGPLLKGGGCCSLEPLGLC
jgi:aarF domain-containing kinase